MMKMTEKAKISAEASVRHRQDHWYSASTPADTDRVKNHMKGVRDRSPNRRSQCNLLVEAEDTQQYQRAKQDRECQTVTRSVMKGCGVAHKDPRQKIEIGKNAAEE